MADLLSRPLSVEFSTRYLKRITHEEVIESLKTCTDQSKIKAIQITERKCIITVNDNETKNHIILEGLRIQNRLVQMRDADSLITNVTLKDAPVEMSDNTIMQQVHKFGDVIAQSLVRGKIKNTNIENGTRYIKILNCLPILPHTIDIGKFTVRIFADNNRTQCKYCGDTNHQYFKCPQKTHERDQSSPLYSDAVKKKACYNCKSTDHVRKDCPKGTICHGCFEEGHIQENCPKELYGKYAYDIMEGQLSKDNTSRQPSLYDEDFCDAKDNISEPTVPEESIEADELDPPDVDINNKSRVRLIIGDSNMLRLHVKDPTIKNVSYSGESLMDFDNLLSKVKLTQDETVDAVIIHLGTNDMKNRSNENIVNDAKDALHAACTKWPRTPVAISSIIPRRGTNLLTKAVNKDSIEINNLVREACSKKKFYHFIDNDEIFLENGRFSKHLYDARDPTGIHVNDEGAEALYDKFLAYFDEGESDELVCQTPAESKKRARGSSSATPPSVDRKMKQGKTE